MARKAHVRPATCFDMDFFHANARDADREEIAAMSGGSIEDSIGFALISPGDVSVWEVDGEPVAIFGTVKNGVEGVIWMIATDDFDKHSREFIRNQREVVEKMITPYQYLYNFVHAKHTKAIRWLKSLGFTILPAEVMGVKGEMFHKFERYVEYV